LEFLGHHRVSLQQQVRHVLATTREDRERLTKHLAGLLTVSLANASAKDQVAHWRLVVETARAANDLNMIRKGAQKILSLKSSTGPDQLFAWSHLAWVAELQLNFRQAYQYTMKLSFPRAHEKHLKLATLAELSGMRAEKHYLDFIKTTPNLNDANQVRAKLTLQDRYPVRRFAEFSSRLRRTPVLAGDLALDVYSKTNDQKFAHSIANDRLLRQTNGGRIIHRDLLLTSFRSQDVSLRRHRLSQRSMKRLADSMKQRIQSLESLERDLKIAIAMRDWTLQVVGSAILVREKNRLYQELIGLRAPYEIPRAQRAAFSQQLKQQAAPFYQSAQLLEQELNKLWSNAGALDTMISSYANIPNIRKSVARRELVALSRYTPANRIEQVSRLINERSSIPSKGQLRSAQQKVANRPFSQGDLNTLLNIAKEREEQTLVQYLLVRKEELGKGVLQ
jgi:hypothetical protein